MKTLRAVCCLLLCAGAMSAQTYVISTVAGGAPVATPASALTGSFGVANSVAAGRAGTMFFASGNCVFKIDSQGSITRVAGTSRTGYSGDGGLAVNAQLSGSLQLAVDASGNLFITDRYNSRVRRVSSTGIITTIAGTGAGGFSGDNGPAVNAQLDEPDGIAVDAAGNLFIADRGNSRIRKVAVSGVITTVAGSVAGFAGDGDQATSAQLKNPSSVALDGSGNLFIGDFGNIRIRRISTSGVISTVAGDGTTGLPTEGASALSAPIRNPYGVATDSSGNLFIADPENTRVWKVSTGGTITTFAGGNGSFSGDGGQAASAGIGYPTGIAVDASGNLFLADTANLRIRKVAANGIITTVMGNGAASTFSGDGGTALSAMLSSPYGVGVDAAGNLFIADSNNNRVRKVTPAGVITTVAGNGADGFSGDGGQATSAQLFNPTGAAVDSAGNLFIADFGNFRIRKVSTTGVITTVAGNGTRGFAGDGGPAISAQLDSAIALAIDSSGNLLIADSGNNRIRKVTTSSGTITTVAGNGASGSGGDGGPALSAQIPTPESITADAAGNFYFTDDSARVRKVASNGIISTVAGSTLGGSGDRGPATQAQISNVIAVAVDGAGNLFIVDTANQRVRKVGTNGTINTIAGTGNAGFYGDGGAGTGAGLNDPYGLAVDSSGNVYVADRDNNAIRKLTLSSQTTFISAVLDSASESVTALAPGKIVAIYGSGLGPGLGVTASLTNNAFGTTLAGTTVSFNGTAAPVIYAGDSQIVAIVPYSVSGTTANVIVSTPSGASPAFSVPVAASSPGFFTANASGAGQAAAINAVEGTLNTATSPVKIGSYISLYLTGEGQTLPGGIDGKLGDLTPAIPILPVTATVDGIAATLQYKGGSFGVVAGLMQVNVQIPAGVTPGGYVPVAVTVGSTSTVSGAVWIAVAAN